MGAKQKELEDKQDMNSKRAYESRAKALAITVAKSDDLTEVYNMWGREKNNDGQFKQLVRMKGMCHTNTTRFNTSAKAWLNNQINMLDERDRPPATSERKAGQLCATG